MMAALVIVALTPVPVAPNIYILGVAAFPVVGGLVVGRQPDNLVGKLLVLMSPWFAIGVASTTYVWLGLETGPLPFSDLAAWLATWSYWPMVPLMTLVVAVFPSGRVDSRWLRPVLWVSSAVIALLIATLMVTPAQVNTAFFSDDVVNPWGIPALAVVDPLINEMLLPIIATTLLIVSFANLLARWRRARGVERLQMRWIGLWLILSVPLGATSLTHALGLTDGSLLILLWLGFGALPVAIGIAVTRYRLYDIDRLVSRSVSYVLLAGLLAAVFATTAIGLPRLVGVPDENPLLVAGATLTAAALFNPLRRRVQAMVDRRFNRARYDAQQEVDRLTQRLRAETDLDDLTDELLDVVSKTMQPAKASVWIKETMP
jgi:hypothetical protein